MRPLTAALAVLAAQQGGRLRPDGVARMRERPIGDLVDALRRLGCVVRLPRGRRLPAAESDGGTARCLDATIRVRGDVSSQFLTALLLALPLAPRSATASSRSRAC